MMTIKIGLYALHIPFKHEFSHASFTRRSTETYLVQAQRGACLGLGEGCPRSYVTGEDQQSGRLAFLAMQDQIAAIDSFEKLKLFRLHNPDFIRTHPALWCAIEMALLDLFSKEKQLPLHEYLGLSFIHETRYTAVLGINRKAKFLKQILLYRVFGFTDFKLKLSGQIDQERFALNMLRAVGIRSLRFDANNLFDSLDAAKDYCHRLSIEEHGFIEEPLSRALGFEKLNTFAEFCPVILDEHFTQVDDLKAIQDPSRFVLNVRVSKLGGILNTLDALQYAKERGFKVIMGAQVGETSALTRAAHVCAGAGASLVIGYEGAFSTHLLQTDPLTPNLRIGRAGRVDFSTLINSPGLGLSLSPLKPSQRELLAQLNGT